MRRPLSREILACLGILGLSITMPAAADVTVTTPYAGVTHLYGTLSTPRPVAFHVVEIDLSTPGLRFTLTPHSGTLETTKQTTLRFLTDQGAQIAVNGHFFEPWPPPSPDPGTADLVGIAASNGDVYSAFEARPAKAAIQPDAPALNLDDSNHAAIVHRAASDTTGFMVAEPVVLHNVVAGNEQIITDGVNTTPDDSWNRDAPRARTAIGLSRDTRTLFLFTVDNAGSSQGLTPFEVAELLRAAPYSVYNALNLDGGGSTTLAMEDPATGGDSIVNVPEAAPRAVGSSLAVFAAASSPSSVALERRIASSADDAEESAAGAVSLTSSDLELMIDGSTQRMVGLRFANVTIPRGARITRAFLQLRVDEAQSEATTLTLRGEASDSARAFVATSGNLTSRARTAAGQAWSGIPAWTTIDAPQQSPDLALVVEEIVGRPGWKSGNALAILISGTGHRTARAFDGSVAGAPLLHVEYASGSPSPPATNRAPQVSAGPDQTITLPGDALLDGIVIDDGLPAPPATITTTWRRIAGPGTITFASASSEDSRASFSTAGTYAVELEARDGALATRDTATIRVNPTPAPATTLERRVTRSEDDAEESATGAVSLTSSDLELMIDGSSQRMVGLRFSNVAIPRGARITRAFLHLHVDEAQSEATTLTLRGEASDSARAFVATSGNLTSRARTSAGPAWSGIPAWTTIDALQQSPDLALVVQEIVGRSGWKSGNPLAILISGTGHRTARAFDGSAPGAPLLHVEFTAPASAMLVAEALAALDGPARLDASVTPNPLRDRATLVFSNPSAGVVAIDLFDLSGRRSVELLNAWQASGRHALEIRPRLLSPSLGPGIYFYRVRIDGKMARGRLVILE